MKNLIAYQECYELIVKETETMSWLEGIILYPQTPHNSYRIYPDLSYKISMKTKQEKIRLQDFYLIFNNLGE